MSSYLIYPSADTTIISQKDFDDISFVENCFKYEYFEESYINLIAFDEILEKELTAWNDGEISYWRILVRHLFAMSLGNLKHLLPFISFFSEVISKPEVKDITFVWPQADIFTDTVRLMADNAGDLEVNIDIDPLVINPTPTSFMGDDNNYQGFRKPKIISKMKILFLVGLLRLGKLIKCNSKRVDKHVIYSSKGYREVTDELINSESITISTLQPFLLELLSLPIKEMYLSKDANDVYAEDVIDISSRQIRKLFKHYDQLYNSRNDLAELLYEYLFDIYGGSPSIDYLIFVINDLIIDQTFLKHLVYLHLFRPDSGIKSLTSVTGGVVQEVLFELGKAYKIPIYDLNHTVLMMDPPEIFNRADRISIKGKPDYEFMLKKHPSEKLILTGRPYSDRLFWYYKSLHKTEEQHLPEEMVTWNSTLLIATEPIRDAHITRVIKECFRSKETDGVCIKLHPKESLEHYLSLMSAIDNRGIPYIVVKDDYSLFDLLASSQLVVNVSSNVGLEALSIGVPALHVEVPSNVRLYYQSLNYFEPYCCSLIELKDMIDKLIKEGVPDDTVQKIHSMYLIDGNCGHRLLEKMYKENINFN